MNLTATTLLFLLSVSVAQAASTSWQSNPQGRVRVIADANTVAGQEKLSLGLHFQPAPGWYLYWKEPGEAGIPPKVTWRIKKGIGDIELLWPAPTRLELPGDITEYGYRGETVYPLQGRLTGGPVVLEAEVSYLTCNTSCIPYRYVFHLELPVGSVEEDEESGRLINAALARVPPPNISDAQVQKEAPVVKLNPGEAGAPAPQGGLPGILLLALMGGLILNVMPCVLPVLSIKLIGLINSAHGSRWEVARGALASAAGIVLSFEALAFAAIAAKSAGHAVGWGIQFQNPWFIGVLLVIVLVFALNMWGLFEINLPGSVNQAAAVAGQKDGLHSYFLSGLFATLLATPCSAPFLGTAMGFALAQPAGTILTTFTACGLGMSLPYLGVAVFPQSLRWLPKPGQWMISLKKFFAVLLALTALWLGWVLKQQLNPPLRASFDESRIAAYLAEGKPVFVDVTADWCVTCKYNERFVLNSSSVQAALREKNVVIMVADWTHRDETIRRYLNQFGRSGIPFYAYYRPGREPVLLSEFLTKKQVLDALKS